VEANLVAVWIVIFFALAILISLTEEIFLSKNLSHLKGIHFWHY